MAAPPPIGSALLFLFCTVSLGCTGTPPAGWKMPVVPKAVSAVSWGSGESADSAAAPERGDAPELTRPAATGMWLNDESRAFGEARRNHRALLIDFSAEWCAPCMQLQAETFSDEAVRAAIASDFVPLRVDVTEESRANREQLRRYRVQGLPVVLLLDADGHEIDRIDRYLGVDAFLERLAAARGKLDGSRHAHADK